MSKLQKCKIAHCPDVLCRVCWHWYNSANPESVKTHQQACAERPTPSRGLLPYSPACRASFSRTGNKTWAEIDAWQSFILKQNERILYVKGHPKRKPRRKEREVRTTRATNSAPTSKLT